MSTMMLRYAARSSVWKRFSFSSSSSVRCLSSSADGEPKGTPYDKLTVGIPKENYPLEKRVAATPESVQRLIKPGFSVIIEDEAGKESFFSNADYEKSGAKVVPKDDVWKKSDIVLKVRVEHEVNRCCGELNSDDKGMDTSVLYLNHSHYLYVMILLAPSSVDGRSCRIGRSHHYFVSLAQSK